jgi:molecular chaperone DnaJ
MVRVQLSEQFQREGSDIFTESTISIVEAVLGTTASVETLDGQEEIKVPAGTQPGTRMRMKGRGVPKLGRPGERGDHYITMKVEVPLQLSDEQRLKFKELRELQE